MLIVQIVFLIASGTDCCSVYLCETAAFRSIGPIGVEKSASHHVSQGEKMFLHRRQQVPEIETLLSNSFFEKTVIV
jgi:hypothetical protein